MTDRTTQAEALKRIEEVCASDYSDGHLIRTYEGVTLGHLRAVLALPRPAPEQPERECPICHRAFTSESANFCPYGCGPISGESGYVAAFYELADMMGIAAQPRSPKDVWESEMKPRLAAAFAEQPEHCGGEVDALVGVLKECRLVLRHGSSQSARALLGLIDYALSRALARKADR